MEFILPDALFIASSPIALKEFTWNVEFLIVSRLSVIDLEECQILTLID